MKQRGEGIQITVRLKTKQRKEEEEDRLVFCIQLLRRLSLRLSRLAFKTSVKTVAEVTAGHTHS